MRRRSIKETVSDDCSGRGVLRVDSGYVVWRCWPKLNVFALRIERICWKMALFERKQAVYLQVNILSIEEYQESWVVESGEFRYVGKICWQSVPMPTFCGDNFLLINQARATPRDRIDRTVKLSLNLV